MTRCFAILLLLVFSPVLAIAEEKVVEPPTLTGEERELLELMKDLATQEEAFYKELEKITGYAEQVAYFSEHFPAREFAPKLLAFEERQHGTYAGLMALHRVIGFAGGTHLNGPHFAGRREAIKRLPAYARRAELVAILKNVASGRFEPQCEPLYRTLSESRDADATLRASSRLMLARWMLGWKQARGMSERRLQELQKGAEPDFPTEREFYVERLETLPTALQMQGWEKEAVELLQGVAKSATEIRSPAIQFDEPHRCFLRIDAERTKTMPLLSEIARGILFKELHLQIGKAPPEFKIPLVSGKEWALSGQQGKVVIIQFSFKGCGPCEAMYPDLQAIQKEQGAKVSILSIMADEQLADTEDAVKAGKLTWDVHWDGHRGPIGQQWGVHYYPTIYVLDSKGVVAGQELLGKQLKQKVGELVKLIELP